LVGRFGIILHGTSMELLERHSGMISLTDS
jgi:hypothetical protein